MLEHDTEPVRGLPAHLPKGEQLVWQGSPDWRSLAIRTFHARKIAIYFSLLVAWSIASALRDGHAPLQAAGFALWPLAFGAIAVGLIVLLAWQTARNTVYTFTSRRLVMRFGVALPMTANVPFALIEGAALKTFADGSGDIPMKVLRPQCVSYFLLWPHVRPWHFGEPQPMLRSVPEAAAVAAVLADILAGKSPAPVTSVATAEDAPANDDRGVAPLAAAS